MKRKLGCFLIAVFLALGVAPMDALANAAQPPALVVIMTNAPEDAAVALVTADGLKEVPKTEGIRESYYVFYHQDIGTGGAMTLQISGGNAQYEQIIGAPYLQRYDSVVTLDFTAQTITAGKLPARSVGLVTMRLLLTLALESLVFFLFGFRYKRSWLIFLGLNLITQGFLNISLNGGLPLAIYSMYKFILLEFLVLAAETVGVLALIKEHSPLRRASFAVVANLLSLILGGYLIATLPL